MKGWSFMMWAKFNVIPSGDDTIVLPSDWPQMAGNTALVQFGGGDAVRAAVKYADRQGPPEGGSYEEPETVGISQSLQSRLHVPVSLTYRLVIAQGRIAVGPVIGLLLGIHTHHYNPRHMMKYSDRMGIYPQIGGLIYAFSPKTVDWKKKEAYGLFYNIVSGQWEYGCFPLPEVIYRRDFHSRPEAVQKLSEITGGRLFNSYRFTKMELYTQLLPDKELQKILPPTELSLNFEQVAQFIERYQKVILKPIDLSRGRGMCIIEKFDSVYQVTDYRYKRQITSYLSGQNALEQFFNLNPSFFHKYLIQKYLNLAKIGTSIFDIRVVMQKRKGGFWGCTGIECRASSNSHLTNISRGGFALTLPDALEQAFGRHTEGLADNIVRYCRMVCERLDQTGRHFGELGLDIAVDQNRTIWLIEANVFPSFKGFKKTDHATYLAIRYAPLLYALSLTEFEDGGERKQ